LGFNVPEQLALLSELNMKDCDVLIPRNTILVNAEGIPKIYYLLKLSYNPFLVPN